MCKFYVRCFRVQPLHLVSLGCRRPGCSRKTIPKTARVRFSARNSQWRPRQYLRIPLEVEVRPRVLLIIDRFACPTDGLVPGCVMRALGTSQAAPTVRVSWSLKLKPSMLNAFSNSPFVIGYPFRRLKPAALIIDPGRPVAAWDRAQAATPFTCRFRAARCCVDENAEEG